MDENVVKITPRKEYLTAYSQYMSDDSGAYLSSAAIAGIVIGAILGILLLILLGILIYYCRLRQSRYECAYDTDEALGNNFPSAEHALQQKYQNHPNVKAELYI
ncbi:Transmembrane SKG6 [Schistosoma japonicum]|uniref:Transmembrane SKG6 n=1 Tax=Schistosoma japonicum TaxID=6182 RepID=A0A4Z2DEL8_SCHJA|nr:Transmembrane SKG6 [Schistosoma japonicum]